MTTNNFIPLSKPDLQQIDIDEVVKVLKSGMLVSGKKVLEFEDRVSKYLSVDDCIAVANGTATLHLCLVACGIGPGDEVIVPAFSYVATANVVELVGAKPVFIDIDINTFNIDVELIERAITKKTKAIIPVHEFGLCCNIEEVCRIAEHHDLVVIEDAACALGATYNNKKAGSFGHFGSFSLHPRKSITAGEGGVVTTKNKNQFSEKIRVLRNHGISLMNNEMDFIEAGFNYRLTDFQAALALSQFSRLEQIISYKRHLASFYKRYLTNPAVQLPEDTSIAPHTWQTYHVLLQADLDQKLVIGQLKERGIGVNYGAQCIPAQTFYRKKYNHNCEKDFPNALRAFQYGIALPLYELLREEDIHFISSTINQL
jgi:perosamine synthetase